MRAGAAVVEITPTPPVDLNGYILRFGKATGVHDPLYASFLYLEGENGCLLLASLDLLSIDSETASRLKGRIAERTGVPEENIVLAAIHTHSSVGGPFLRNVGKEDPEWKKRFEEKVVEGSVEAKEKAEPVQLRYYQAFSCVGINRRRSERGMDPSAPFITVKGQKGYIAWLVNYGCHPVCLTEDNLLISADYVYYLRERIKVSLSASFPVLFFAGGCGDVDPKLRGSFEAAQRTGYALAEELLLVERSYEGLEISGPVRSLCRKLKLPYGWQPGIEEAEKVYQHHKRLYEEARTEGERKVQGAFLQWAQDLVRVVREGSLPSELETDVCLLGIGPFSMLVSPFEIFSSISLKLRQILGPVSFVVGYANGYRGYLPDRPAFVEGGYEVEEWHKYGGILPLAPDAEERFLKLAQELAREV